MTPVTPEPTRITVSSEPVRITIVKNSFFKIVSFKKETANDDKTEIKTPEEKYVDPPPVIYSKARVGDTPVEDSIVRNTHTETVNADRACCSCFCFRK